MNIIDTKSDLAFKKIFGEKPHLLMSLLNSLLPLDNPIIELQYLSPEIIPELDDGKNSIVDVRCMDSPKWKKLNKFDLNNSQDRWLMYFTEPTLYDRLSKEEYARFKEICEALDSAEVRNFSPEKIYGYELYIDSIHQYHTTMTLERREGREEGISLSFQILEELKKNVLSPEEIALKFDTDIELVLKVKSML